MRTAVIFAIWISFATSVARAQPAVALEAVTDRKFYRELAPSEIHVEARVTVIRPPANPTPAVRNVAFVLDRSGSMAGEPIEALRRAASAALEALAPHDVVAVILFGSEVETLVEAQRRDQLAELDTRIAQIEPAGGAALYDALNQAAAQLRRHATPSTINQLLLVTDGPPTKGPRELEDFARLAEVFAREGMRLSTLGLGPEFNEDMLAAMARTAHGRFRYVAQPGQLADVLKAEIAPASVVVGHDAELAIEFKRDGRKLRSYGWRAPTIGETRLTWRFPQLLSDEPVSVLASAEIESFHARFDVPDFAVATLRWKDAATGEPREIARVLPARFSRDSLDLRDALDAGVARSGSAAVLRENFQRAIEQLDQGDPRRALRTLRAARSEVRDINFDLDDPRIDEMVRQLDAYLSELQSRILGPLDRKILRSGLSNRFDPPAPIVEPKN